MLLGTTFSHRHSQYLRLPPEETVQELLAFGFDRIRLGCYWEEIEPEKGRYDFSQISSLLKKCEEKKQSVILTVGMKAPRWPEYYFPRWLPEKSPAGAAPFVFSLLQKSIETLKKFTCITHWQVENEPLDPSGARELAIPAEILRREIAIVREHDDRPVVVNLWGNELSKRNLLPIANEAADVIGLDLYYKVPLFARLYRGPDDSDEKLRNIVAGIQKPLWITELQAEPWEASSKRRATPSMNEVLLRKNFDRVKTLNPEAIFFWGFEYWAKKRREGDGRLWDTAQQIISGSR